MSSKKKMAAIAITIAALSAGSISVASAHDGAGKGVAQAAMFADLVKAGTITQAQADAITKKFAEVKAVRDASRVADQAAHDAQRTAQEALVASTLGIDAATIKTRLAAGETLAAIAGVKKDALIAALVAFETKAIDARVTAGTMTAAQAAVKKADLTAHVTAKINDVRGPGMGMPGDKGPKDGKGKGKAPRH